MRNDWLAASDELLLRECRLEFRKASGNGGQKVNKTSSAVRLSHEPSGLVVTSAESRSQHENRRHALKALRMKIALSFRLPPDPGFRIGEPATSLHNPAYPLWAKSAGLLPVSRRGSEIRRGRAGNQPFATRPAPPEGSRALDGGQPHPDGIFAAAAEIHGEINESRSRTGTGCAAAARRY